MYPFFLFRWLCGNGPEESSSVNVQEADSVETLLSIDDPEEKAAVEAAKAKVAAMGEEPRIIATSPATADICDRLDLDLVGVCSSTISALPKRYEDLTQVGTAMSPDMEIISSLDPDWILSPVTLQSDLQPKYEAIHTEWAFLNLRSVPGMYRSIQEWGKSLKEKKKLRPWWMNLQSFTTAIKTRMREGSAQGADPYGTSRFLISLPRRILMWAAW